MRSKRIIAFMLALLVLLPVCGCKVVQNGNVYETTATSAGTTATTEASTSVVTEPAASASTSAATEATTAEPASNTLSARIVGTYVRELDASEKESVEVRYIGGMLLIEHLSRIDGEVCSFCAEEFWPEDDALLDGEGDSVSGKSGFFSAMSLYGQYWDAPIASVVRATDGGIALTDSETGDEVLYTRADSEEYAYHTSPSELYTSCLSASYALTGDVSAAGVWSRDTLQRSELVCFYEDNTFMYISKRAGEPIKAEFGAWGVSADSGRILAFGEEVGNGSMPVNTELDWSAADGELTLSEFGETDPDAGTPYTPAPDGWRLPAELSEFFTENGGGTPDVYVDESCSTIGEYTSVSGNFCSYSFSLPMITGGTEAANQINEEINNTFLPTIEEQLADIAAGNDIWVYSISWYSYTWEGILAVVVTAETNYSYNYFGVYSYDTAADASVGNTELLARLGTTPDDFLSVMRTTAQEYFIAAYSGLTEQQRNDYGYYDCLERTLSDGYINMDLQMYIDNLGILNVITPIASMAGADYYYHILCPYGN